MENQVQEMNNFDCELYVIFDRIAHRYSSPLPFQNQALAKRYFESLLQNCDNIRTKPSDYELYYIGMYSTNDAMLFAKSPEYVYSGSEIKFDIKTKDGINNGKGKK